MKIPGMIVMPPAAHFRRLEEFPATPRAIVIPWKAEEARWEELKYCLRSFDYYFADRECLIYILAAAPPEWLSIGGRIRFLEHRTYAAAAAVALQLAEVVLLANDDQALLQPLDWEDFREPRCRGEFTTEQLQRMAASNNGWDQSRLRAREALRHEGRGCRDYETHLPYVFHRAQAMETLVTYGMWTKAPFMSLHANHHRIEGVPLDALRTGNPRGAGVLCYEDGMLTDDFKAALASRFPQPAPWEIDTGGRE